jgi:acyl-CoA thioesterase
MNGHDLSPQATAEHVAEMMMREDRACQALGIAVASIAPGRAVMTMTVRPDMLNGFGLCHGGLIATLADSAFAYACNAYNALTVASGLSVDFLAPGREGDRLTAAAEEVSLAGRTGVYDVTVTNQRGERIAVFRGRSHRMKGRPTVPPAV